MLSTESGHTLAGGEEEKNQRTLQSEHLNWTLRRRRNSASVAQESESSERKTNTNKNLSVEFSSAAN